MLAVGTAGIGEHLRNLAIDPHAQGAAGVDMGRNIFQSEAPKAMLATIESASAPRTTVANTPLSLSWRI